MLPEGMMENIIKLLPTLGCEILVKVYRRLMTKIKETKTLIDGKDYLRLALISSLIKSLQQPNFLLKLYAMDIMIELMEKRLLDEHPSVFNIAVEIVLYGKDICMVVVGALKLLRRILFIDPNYELERLHRLNLVDVLIGWLNDETLPYMCYEGVLNILNSLILSPVLQKYDIVDLLVKLFYRVARSHNPDNERLPHSRLNSEEAMCLLSEISCAFLLLQKMQDVLPERLLSSTNLLETIMFIL
jgi:hypothetical protein